MLTLGGIAAALVFGTLLQVGAGSAAGAKTGARCEHHKVFRRTRSVLVYSVTSNRPDGLGNLETFYYACLRPNGRSVAIAVDSTRVRGEYFADYVLKKVAIDGHFVGTVVIRGEGSQEACQKYAQPHCPTPWTTLRVANVRTRKTATLQEPLGTTSFTLSPAGAIAWLVPQPAGATQLMAATFSTTARGARLGARTLDSGHLSQLRFSGRTLSWLNGTTPHHVTL